MRVLVLEDVLGAGDEVAGRLAASGSTVVRCHEPGAPAGVCVGMPGGSGCPLETGTVDVALSVRSASGPVTVVEDGVRCALRHHVPLVTLGAPEDSPWVALATASLTDADDLEATVRDAADAPLRTHGAIAAGELRAVLDRHDLPSTAASAEVVRRSGGLRVALHPAQELAPDVAQAAAVRVAAALRAHDERSGSLDVSVASSPRRLQPA